jgi:pSer/pThr/pTyr-binding forkhead associated (FHA) protein
MSNNSTHVPKRVILQVAIDPASSQKGSTVAANWIFPGEKLRVGRSASHADLVFELDLAMSRGHFELQFDGEECRLLDLGSANGTRVNGKPVERLCVIEDGDELCAGKTIFRIGIMGEEEAGEPLPPTPMSASPNTQGLQDEESMLLKSSDLPDTKRATGGLPGVATLRLKTESLSADDAALMTRVLAWIRPSQSIVVGSSEFEADWCVPESWGVAQRHFRIMYDGATCTISNCGSGVSTCINGETVGDAEVVVSDGDEIQAGSALFAVQLWKDSSKGQT